MNIHPEKEITLRDLVAIYRRRRSIIVAFALASLSIAAIYCALCTRRYEATGKIEVRKESSSPLGLDSLSGGGSDDADGLDANINLETQTSILESDTLALDVIQKLHLEETSDFRPKWSPIGWILGLVSPSGPPDPTTVNIDAAPRRRQHAVHVFSKNLKVKPVTGTRLIEISYLNPNPKVASAVVNELMQSLMDYGFQTRYEATSQASSWLNGQLGDLRKEAEDLQAKVAEMQKQSGVYSFSMSDTGNGPAEGMTYSATLDELQRTTQALQDAIRDRILKGAIAQAAESGDAEMLSGLAGDSLNGPGSSSSLNAILALRNQEASQRAALEEAEAKFGPAYPKLDELRAAIAGTDGAIHDEVKRLAARANTDYVIAQKTEEGIRQRYEEDKNKADLLNNKAIEYKIVQQEAADSREIYEDLLKHLKEAGVLEGLRSTDITVVDPGRIPALPKVPNVPLYLGAALCAGLFMGCCSAFVVDSLDNKIQGISELESISGQTLFGVTPQFSRMLPASTDAKDDGRMALTQSDPNSTYAESIRSIRTAILLARGDKVAKTILVTSSIAGEGKTVFSTNLATVMAQQGKRVLIVETDLRRGTMRHRLPVAGGPGLSSLLSGLVSEPRIQAVSGMTTLFALTGGSTPPNPSELLGSESMRSWLHRWSEEFDFVILDGAPILPVTDSVILAAMVDMAILLARYKYTERPQFERSCVTLMRNQVKHVGVVFNGISPRDRSYYGYYGYYGYRQNAYSQSEDEAND